MGELAKRKPTGLNGFDYNSTDVYFLTICTQNRQCLLSRIVGTGILDATSERSAPNLVGADVLDGPSVELSPYGRIADKFINQLNDFYENISVQRYVIMPNHIHLLLFVRGNGPSRTSAPTSKQHSTVSRFVSTFKRFCNKEYGENIWQSHFNDHIIRNREDYDEHNKYIYENPMRWYYDELFSNE